MGDSASKKNPLLFAPTFPPFRPTAPNRASWHEGPLGQGRGGEGSGTFPTVGGGVGASHLSSLTLPQISVRAKSEKRNPRPPCLWASSHSRLPPSEGGGGSKRDVNFLGTKLNECHRLEKEFSEKQGRKDAGPSVLLPLGAYHSRIKVGIRTPPSFLPSCKTIVPPPFLPQGWGVRSPRKALVPALQTGEGRGCSRGVAGRALGMTPNPLWWFCELASKGRGGGNRMTRNHSVFLKDFRQIPSTEIFQTKFFLVRNISPVCREWMNEWIEGTKIKMGKGEGRAQKGEFVIRSFPYAHTCMSCGRAITLDVQILYFDDWSRATPSNNIPLVARSPSKTNITVTGTTATSLQIPSKNTHNNQTGLAKKNTTHNRRLQI